MQGKICEYIFRSNGGLFCLLSVKYFLNVKIGKYHSDIPQFKLGHI